MSQRLTSPPSFGQVGLGTTSVGLTAQSLQTGQGRQAECPSTGAESQGCRACISWDCRGFTSSSLRFCGASVKTRNILRSISQAPHIASMTGSAPLQLNGNRIMLRRELVWAECAHSLNGPRYWRVLVQRQICARRWGGLPAAGLGQLTSDPFRRWVRRHTSAPTSFRRRARRPAATIWLPPSRPSALHTPSRGASQLRRI
jgi:hypothetical protein